MVIPPPPQQKENGCVPDPFPYRCAAQGDRIGKGAIRKPGAATLGDA
jgi:hypothetical protein